MKNVIFEHAAEIITALVSFGIAWVKRRLDIKNLKKDPSKIDEL